MEGSSDSPRYTTVGSIANPNLTPLRAPARRGRSVKWPSQQEFGLVPSPLSGLSLVTDSSSCPPDGQSLHYSPLQQNTDRAVSPTFESSSRNAPATSMTSMGSSTQLKYGEHTSVSALRKYDSSDDGEPTDYVALNAMSVKTLTNLASYDNPKQKTAQKILTRARNPQQATRPQSDRATATGFEQSDGGLDAEIRTFPSYRDVIMSTRPGAPRPLTAGPPGNRQYRSSTLGQAAAGRRSATQAAPAQVFQNYSRALSPHALGNVFGVETQDGAEIAPRKVLHSNSFNRNIVDTLDPDTARRYYADGSLPANFNHQTQFSTPTGGVVYLENGAVHFSTKETISERNARITALWSEGTEMLGKSLEQALRDQRHQDFSRLVGLDQTGGAMKPKVVYKPLSVSEANRISTKDHAQPLLSMVFQTLINLESFTLSGNLPKLEYREL